MIWYMCGCCDINIYMKLCTVHYMLCGCRTTRFSSFLQTNNNSGKIISLWFVVFIYVLTFFIPTEKSVMTQDDTLNNLFTYYCR